MLNAKRHYITKAFPYEVVLEQNGVESFSSQESSKADALKHAKKLLKTRERQAIRASLRLTRKTEEEKISILKNGDEIWSRSLSYF